VGAPQQQERTERSQIEETVALLRHLKLEVAQRIQLGEDVGVGELTQITKLELLLGNLQQQEQLVAIARRHYRR